MHTRKLKFARGKRGSRVAALKVKLLLKVCNCTVRNLKLATECFFKITSKLERKTTQEKLAATFSVVPPKHRLLEYRYILSFQDLVS